jgi:chromosome segregation ATPase
MNAAALADPETLKAFAALIELLANPAQHKKAVAELKAMVETSQTALQNAHQAQVAADADKKEAERLVALSQETATANGRDRADIGLRMKQLDDHAQVLAKRQAELETYAARSEDEFAAREKRIAEANRELKGQSDELDEHEEAVAEREQAVAKREADVAKAEARLREIMGVTRSYSLEAETGQVGAAMGGR